MEKERESGKKMGGEGDKEKGDRCGGQGGETVNEKEMCVWLREVGWWRGGERETGTSN